MRLVVVEDLGDLNALYQVLLTGHEIVCTFSTATAARAWAGWDTVDAVISDHALPGMKGSELLTWLAQAHPNVGRIMVSAHNPDPQARATAHVYADKLAFVDNVQAVLDRLP